MTRSGPRSTPNQPEGDVAKLPLFPTTRLSEFRTESQHASDSTFRDALDPADTDSSSAVQCLIVTSEQTRDGEVPLEEHVRRAWEYHGGDIDSAVTSTPRRAGPAQRRRGRLPAKSRSSRRSAVDLQVAHAFDTTSSLTLAVNAVCRADVAVFDATDFQQAGIMFLLGVRAVARRGVTICSVGGEYVMGAELAVPFNLQMLNLAAHSSAQEQIPGSDPRDLIGKKIANGFRELANLPDYLDLPAATPCDAWSRLVGVPTRSVRQAGPLPVPVRAGVLKSELGQIHQQGTVGQAQRTLSQGGQGRRRSATGSTAGSQYTPAGGPDVVRVDPAYRHVRRGLDGLPGKCDVRGGSALGRQPLGAGTHRGAVRQQRLPTGTHPAEHVAKMIALFSPIAYLCKPGHAAAYQRMIDRFEGPEPVFRRFQQLDLPDRGPVYGDMPSPSLPVADELVRSADLLLSGDYESSGICRSSTTM